MSNSSNRQRKIPKQERSTELVSAILDACVRIFRSSRPLKFSTRSVAEIAGISVGSLYQYFPNKDALTGALIEREANRHIRAAEAKYAALRNQGATAVVQGLVREILETVDRDKTLLRSILTSVFLVERIDSLIEARELGIDFVKTVLLEQHLSKDEQTARTQAYVIVASIGGIVEAIIFRKDASETVERLCAESASMILRYCSSN